MRGSGREGRLASSRGLQKLAKPLCPACEGAVLRPLPGPFAAWQVVMLMFTKKWFERSLGNEHREHEKLSSLSKRAAPGGPGARPSPYGFPGRSLWRARPGRTEEMTVPLGTVNDIRSMDAAGRSRSEAARVLRASRNTVAKYADMEDVSPAAPMPQRRGGPALEGNEEWVAGVLEADLGARGSSATPPGGSTTDWSPSAATPARAPPRGGSSASPGSPGRRRAEMGTSSSSGRPAPARSISGTSAPRPAGGPSTPGCWSRRSRTRTTGSAPPSCRRGRSACAPGCSRSSAAGAGGMVRGEVTESRPSL